MSDKPQNKAKSTDRVEDKALDKPSTNPEVAKESQTDAKGQHEIELQRTNKHDGSAGKSDQGDIDSVRIESIDEHGNKKVASRKDGGSEQDLLPPDRPAGGFEELHRADGGITLKGVIPGPGEELENITTGTMKALASENPLVKNALEMREQIDQHMEPGPERDKAVRQLKTDVTASLMSGEIGENEIGGTHKAIDLANDSSESIDNLPPEQQLQAIGKLLLTNSDNYLQEQKERAIGAAVGTVESIGEMTMDLVNIAEFVGDVIVGNKEQAAEKGAKFGEAVGKTIVGGVNIFNAAHKYLNDIGFEGDYSKPFRDIHSLGMALDREWTKLPPLEQERLKYKLATDVIAGAIPIGSATKITRSQKLTTALEEAATLGNELKHGEKTTQSIKEVLTDFLGKKRKPNSAQGLENEKSNNILEGIVDDVRQRRAGAGGDWPTINERHSDEVIRQANDLACTSAVGQMLSDGKISQESILERIGFPADLDDLATVLREDLGQPWKSITVSKKGLETLLKKGEPFGANLKDLHTGQLYEKIKLPHTVFVEGLDEIGNLVIKDPWEQTTYGMTFEDFYKHWTNWTIYQE